MWAPWPKFVTNGLRETTAAKSRFNLYKIHLSYNIYNAAFLYKTNYNSSVFLPTQPSYFSTL